MKRQAVLFVAFLASLTFLPIDQVSAQGDIDAFEQELDETIKVACHGYAPDMLPEFLAWLRDDIYEGSPFCKRVSTIEDVQLRALTRELKRSGPDLDLSKRDDSGVQRAMECKHEYMCVAVRDRLYREGAPISQVDYDRVSQYCDERYACIEAFFLDWPQPLPLEVAQPASASSMSGLSLASLRKQKTDPEPQIAGDQTSGVGLGSVFEERRQIAFENGQRELKTVNLRIGDQCACSTASGRCYNNPYGPVKDQVASLEQQRQGQCLIWNQTIAGRTPANQSELDASLAQATDIAGKLNRLDQQADTVIAQAAKDYERAVAAAKKKQEEANSFQWGKLAALGVGAVAGGITELETADQVEFIGAMVKDSMGGAQGIGNMQAKAAGGPASMPSASSVVAQSGSFSLSCDLPSQSACVEYTLPDKQTYDQFIGQCKSAGARIAASCTVSGPTCTMRTGGRTAVTITPGQDASVARENCESNGGTFSVR